MHPHPHPEQRYPSRSGMDGGIDARRGRDQHGCVKAPDDGSSAKDQLDRTHDRPGRKCARPRLEPVGLRPVRSLRGRVWSDGWRRPVPTRLDRQDWLARRRVRRLLRGCRARLAGWQAAYASRAVVYHKFSASHRRGSPLKTYLCERNRIWNLVQNYPWRYVVLTVPWNSARNVAGSIPWTNGTGPAAGRVQNPILETARAMARARVDAYAGIPRALGKRRARAVVSRVSPATVGDWLRRYHVSFRDAVLA